jgi:tryptophanyl-tRNA synthetase
MIELTAEIVRRFNALYGPPAVFPVPVAVTPRGGRLPGIDGLGKAGKTTGNAIFLGDSADAVKDKVMSMYTDPTKASVADPGHIEGHVPFAYLDAFDPDVHHVSELKQHYERGGLGDVAVKRYLIDVLDALMTPIRERRTMYASDPQEVLWILRRGTEKTRVRAAQVLEETRGAMGLDYIVDLPA